ncbi:RNA-binding protein [Skeletonema marinoi]|uniref:RNA-binding protein n=1 Tax=Skeletonema marinoi TaxID=267567 RepID=A0AAD8XWW7_9STRA|nr:RNA-binding protein [Skeletonema marinoi]
MGNSNSMKQQLCDMNDTTAYQYEDAAAANFPRADSPPATFASTSTLISWAYQSTLPPVVVPHQHGRAPSPTSVASTSTSMAMMQQPAFVWATYSEPHPHYAPSTEAAPEPYSYTPKAHQFQPPSPPDADSDDHDYDIPLLEYSVKSRRGKELFVAHIPFDMTEAELLALCSQYGDVISASIMRHDLGVSKCFAYVKFKLQSTADNALLRLNRYEVDGKFLFVDYAYAMRLAQERSLSVMMMENIKPIASWSVELHLLLSREPSGKVELFSC